MKSYGIQIWKQTVLNPMGFQVYEENDVVLEALMQIFN